VSQAIYHSRNGRGNLENIRVPVVNHRHWERMGGEEEHGTATFLLKFLESRFDILGDSLIWRERNKRAEGRWKTGGGVVKPEVRVCILQRPAKAERKERPWDLTSHISYLIMLISELA
jgi:hypothetical protein